MPLHDKNDKRKLRLMIAGAQKSGTSSLATWLFRSPYITGHSELEMVFFTIHSEYQLGFEWALKHYYPQAQPETILAAKNVDMIEDCQALSRLQSHNEKCTIVLLLRNPIERAYSAYWYARRKGWEREKTFEDALKSEPKGKVSTLDFRDSSRQYLQKGCYINSIRRVEKFFPKKQIAVFLLEDMQRRPEYIYKTVHAAMGVNDVSNIKRLESQKNRAARSRSELISRLLSRRIPHPEFVRVPIILRAKKRLRERLREINEVEFKAPPMRDETRKIMQDFYENYNSQLADYLNRDLSHWM